jgi:hyperosmotically inducible protein
VAAAAVFFAVFHRDRPKSRSSEETRPTPSASDSPSAEAEGREAPAASDAAIQTSLQRALRSDPLTRRQDIDIEVDEGIVTLSGSMPAAAAREAEALARRVDGVRKVVSAIVVEEDEGGQTVVPMPPVAPAVPRGPVLAPRGPQYPHGRPPADSETVQRLLHEAQDALHAGNAGEAMGKFAAVMGMDPHNEEAKQGMKDATLLLGETIRRRVRPLPSPSS